MLKDKGEFLAVRSYVGSPISTDVRPGAGGELLSLVIKRKVAQNVNRMSKNKISVCQYVRIQLFGIGAPQVLTYSPITDISSPSPSAS